MRTLPVKFSRACWLNVAILLLVPTSVAVAGELAPGGSATGPDYAYNGAPPVQGTVVGSKSSPFEVSVVAEDVRYFQQGTLTQQVYREESGRLSFLYTITAGQSNATTDLVSLAATGFSGFTTDVFSNADFPPQFTRSANGDRVTVLDNGTPGTGLLIRTNALDYAEGGTGVAAIRFQGNPGGTPDQVASFATFRPVPEPSALALLGSAGLLALRRRRFAR